MIKKVITGVVLYILILALATAASPSVGFRLATYTGIVIAQPISIGLKLGLMIRGSN